MGFVLWFIAFLRDYLALITFVYQFILMIVALKGLSKLSWGQSIISVIVSMPMAALFGLFLASLLQVVPQVIR
jgi:uncharacterized membrane protein